MYITERPVSVFVGNKRKLACWFPGIAIKTIFNHDRSSAINTTRCCSPVLAGNSPVKSKFSKGLYKLFYKLITYFYRSGFIVAFKSAENLNSFFELLMLRDAARIFIRNVSSVFIGCLMPNQRLVYIFIPSFNIWRHWCYLFELSRNHMQDFL